MMEEIGMDKDVVGSCGSYRLPGKLVHHACGYPLLTEPHYLPRVESETAWVPPGDRVVIHYRSAVPGASNVLVFCCPGCNRPLKLWWEVPA